MSSYLHARSAVFSRMAALGVLLFLTGCSGAPVAVTSPTPANSPSNAPASSPPSSAPTSSLPSGGSASGSPAVTSSGSPAGQSDITVAAEGIDLAGTPPILAAYYSPSPSGNLLNYFDHLSSNPAVTLGPLPATDHYVLSPDSRLAAVEHAGDAVNKARLEIVATDTGQSVATLDVDEDAVKVAAWAPDSTAILASTSSSNSTHKMVVFRVDGTQQIVTADSILGTAESLPWIKGPSGTTVVDGCKGCGDAPFQLVSSKGVLAVFDYLRIPGRELVDPHGVSWGQFDEAGGTIVPFAGEFGQATGLKDEGIFACGRFAVAFKTTSSTQSAYSLYDSDSGKFTPIGYKSVGNRCPVASKGGTQLAFESTDGVRVVDLATGKQTTVARQGHPIAWSSDGSKVVVMGNGTFVVAADGSSGKAASTTIHDYCVVGNTGVVITTSVSRNPGEGTRPVDLLAYDPATDTATPLGQGQLVTDSACEVTADGKWVVTDETIIDVGAGHAAVVTMSSGKQNRLLPALHLQGPGFVTTVARALQ